MLYEVITDELAQTFIQESREQLAEMEAGLLRLEQFPDDANNINAISYNFV